MQKARQKKRESIFGKKPKSNKDRARIFDPFEAVSKASAEFEKACQKVIYTSQSIAFIAQITKPTSEMVTLLAIITVVKHGVFQGWKSSKSFLKSPSFCEELILIKPSDLSWENRRRLIGFVGSNPKILDVKVFTGSDAYQGLAVLSFWARTFINLTNEVLKPMFLSRVNTLLGEKNPLLPQYLWNIILQYIVSEV